MLQCALVDLNIFSKLLSVSQRLWSNIGGLFSASEMQKNAEKWREMQRNAKKCRKMQRDAERCREIQRNVKK